MTASDRLNNLPCYLVAAPLKWFLAMEREYEKSNESLEPADSDGKRFRVSCWLTSREQHNNKNGILYCATENRARAKSSKNIFMM
jgi:hypothetical protein